MIIDIAEIAAVSALKIFLLILIGLTPSKERTSSLSNSEKSPSGPIIKHIGLFVSFFVSNFSFSEFKSVNIKSIVFPYFHLKIFLNFEVFLLMGH